MEANRLTKEEFDKMSPEQQADIRAAFKEAQNKARLDEERQKIKFAMTWELFKNYSTGYNPEMIEHRTRSLTAACYNTVTEFLDEYAKEDTFHKERVAAREAIQERA